jgi:hypothetical protein
MQEHYLGGRSQRVSKTQYAGEEGFIPEVYRIFIMFGPGALGNTPRVMYQNRILYS